MRRIVAVGLLVSLGVGCRAPAPSMNFTNPYGSATVPAPRTGSVGTSGDYYAPPNPAGAGGVSNPANGTSGLQAPPGATGSFSSSPLTSAVAPASYTSAGPAGSSNLQLNGMRVNEAPPLNNPTAQPTNLTQLPDTSQSPSALQILTAGATGTGTPTPALSPPPSPASGNWQTRY